MRIAFCGTHATGKTTMARLVAERLGGQFMPSVVRAAFKDQGVPNDVPALTQDQRQRAQELVLSRWIEQAVDKDPPKIKVFDRSPICFIGYTLVNLGLDQEWALDYFERCQQAALQYLDMIVFAPMTKGIKVESEPGRGLVDPVYMRLHQHALIGELANFRDFAKSRGPYFRWLQERRSDLNYRVDLIEMWVEQVIEGTAV